MFNYAVPGRTKSEYYLDNINCNGKVIIVDWLIFKSR